MSSRIIEVPEQTQAEAISVFRPKLKQSLNMIDHGLVIKENKPLFPVTKHRSERLFSPDALFNFFVEQGRIDYTTHVKENTIEENSAFELFKEFESTVVASGETKFLGMNFASTAASEFGYKRNTSKNVSFAQVKRLCEVASVSMPEDEDLRSLLDKNFREKIDNISSMKEARDFVKRYGVVYISDASWGGSLVLTTSSQKTQVSKETSLLASLEVEMKALTSSASVSTSVSQGETTSSTQENFRYSMASVGGDPSRVKDVSAWMQSVATTPALVDIKVRDISELALPDSQSQQYLKDAVVEYSLKYASLLEEDVFLKGVQHLVKYHWKKPEMLRVIEEHQNNCAKLFGKKGFSFHGISSFKYLQQMKSLQEMIQNGKETVQSLIVKINVLSKQQSNELKSISKTAFKKHTEVLNKLLSILAHTGTMGLNSGSVLSFFNDKHGRFLKLREASLEMATGKVTQPEKLTDPNLSQFELQPRDKARGLFSLRNPSTDTYLIAENGVVRSKQLDDNINEEDSKFPESGKFTFYHTQYGVNICACTTKQFLAVDDATFQVKLSDKRNDSVTYFIKESA